MIRARPDEDDGGGDLTSVTRGSARGRARFWCKLAVLVSSFPVIRPWVVSEYLFHSASLLLATGVCLSTTDNLPAADDDGGGHLTPTRPLPTFRYT